MRLVRAILDLILALGLVTGGMAVAQSPRRANWVASWEAAQRLPEPENSLPPDELRNATLRQIVHLSIGGSRLRVHISNAFGTAAMHFTSVHIAMPISATSARIDPATDKALSFSGNSDATVPAGAEYISDPINYGIASLSDLAVTLHIDAPPARQTGHPLALATSYLVHGNQVSAPDLPNAKKFDHWFHLAAVDVDAPADAACIVALGDSITAGAGGTTNGNTRYTDVLAERFSALPHKKAMGVLNAGISGNHLLTDGPGANALARFDSDVLAQAGVRYLIMLEGTNDLRGLTRNGEVSPTQHTVFIHRIISSYEQIVVRSHAHGIKVIGATILPITGTTYLSHGQSNEADRQAINHWIRTSGRFDAVLDFDEVTRDPDHPERLLPVYDSGDHLHLSPAGYRALAKSIPLSLFTR
ncbi:MAG TPA: SGNH/GDSL hydrolase family protein [Terriglobia bacterium]|nr:SGNH/GDSL hydrolase family protein [Terriglobia bacterium]